LIRAGFEFEFQSRKSDLKLTPIWLGTFLQIVARLMIFDGVETMKMKFFCLVLMVATINWSCSNEWEQVLMKMSNSERYSNSLDGWVLKQEIEYNELNTHYFITKTDGDTLKTLSFLAGGTDNWRSADRYVKEYPCGSTDTCHLILHENDTLYWYSESKGLKNFLSGEYMYRSERLLFDEDEQNYFEFFKDSLRKVKGNDLPDLPNLNDEQLSELLRGRN
jgi:hypothetical protein